MNPTQVRHVLSAGRQRKVLPEITDVHVGICSCSSIMLFFPPYISIFSNNSLVLEGFTSDFEYF
ncbi:hypothetical protein AMI01nite_04070 [Aneurinibacillus migulanus]|nr:hypothetical protein AMI01nite_04070 [Aneurinibacillus migulanus]